MKFVAHGISSKGKSKEILHVFIDGKGFGLASDKHNLYFKVLNASQHRDIVKYDEAKAICERENKTLPRSFFRVIEKGHEFKSIFWLAEDEQSRKEANDEFLQDQAVSFVYEKSELCAILGKYRNLTILINLKILKILRIYFRLYRTTSSVKMRCLTKMTELLFT